MTKEILTKDDIRNLIIYVRNLIYNLAKKKINFNIKNFI